MDGNLYCRACARFEHASGFADQHPSGRDADSRDVTDLCAKNPHRGVYIDHIWTLDVTNAHAFCVEFDW